jgi:hypothetical protein
LFGLPATYFDFATFSFHVPTAGLADWAKAVASKMTTATAATARTGTCQILERRASTLRIIAPHKICPDYFVSERRILLPHARELQAETRACGGSLAIRSHFRLGKQKGQQMLASRSIIATDILARSEPR